MRRKKLFILSLSLAVFCLLEIGIIVFWSFFSEHKTSASCVKEKFTDRDIRVGILPGDLTRYEAKKKWIPFLHQLSEDSKLNFRPYFTESFDEIVVGINHNLDLIHLNSAMYLKLKDREGLEAMAYSYCDDGDHYAVLVAKRDRIQFLDETKGKRITFTDKLSMTGYLVPKKFLVGRFNMPVTKWFSQVSYAGTDLQAILDLLNDRTDVIAVNYSYLKMFTKLKEGRNRKLNLRILWMFRSIPEDVFCMNPNLKEPLKSKITKSLVKDLSEYRPRKVGDEEKPVFFVPIDYKFDEEMSKFERFIKQTDKDKKQDNPEK